MKRLLLGCLATSMFPLLQGCKEQKRITIDQVNAIQDSIPHIISGVRSIHTMQNDEDLAKVVIVVGAPSFYNAPEADKQRTGTRVGEMLMRVLGPGNSISNATLVLTLKDSERYEIPDDGIKIDMKADSIRKAMYPGK